MSTGLAAFQKLKATMLLDQYTLNVGNPAADVVFDRQFRNGLSTGFTADSPNDDLAGRLALKVSHQMTNANIVRSLGAQFKKPIKKTGEADYSGFILGSFTLQRPDWAVLQDALDIIEMTHEFISIAGVASAIAEMEC